MKKHERFVQTMIAVFATNTMFIPAVPLVAALLPYLDQKAGSVAGADRAGAADVVRRPVAAGGAGARSCVRRSSGPGSAPFSVVIAINLGAPILLGLIFGDLQKPA